MRFFVSFQHTHAQRCFHFLEIKVKLLSPPIMDRVEVKQRKTIVVSVVMDCIYVHVLQQLAPEARKVPCVTGYSHIRKYEVRY